MPLSALQFTSLLQYSEMLMVNRNTNRLVYVQKFRKNVYTVVYNSRILVTQFPEMYVLSS